MKTTIELIKEVDLIRDCIFYHVTVNGEKVGNYWQTKEDAEKLYEKVKKNYDNLNPTVEVLKSEIIKTETPNPF